MGARHLRAWLNAFENALWPEGQKMRSPTRAPNPLATFVAQHLRILSSKSTLWLSHYFFDLRPGPLFIIFGPPFQVKKLRCPPSNLLATCTCQNTGFKHPHKHTMILTWFFDFCPEADTSKCLAPIWAPNLCLPCVFVSFPLQSDRFSR